MLESGEKREGGALRRFPSMPCPDDGYRGGAMLEKSRPCTGSDGVRETAKGRRRERRRRREGGMERARVRGAEGVL